MNQGIIRNLIDVYGLDKPDGKLHGVFNVLTVQQPYASMLVSGTKPYEFRSWPMSEWLISEPILIHAGARILTARVNVSEEMYNHYLSYVKSRYLFGCIVGVVVFGESQPSDTPPFSGYRFPVREYFQLGRPIWDIKGRMNFWKIQL